MTEERPVGFSYPQMEFIGVETNYDDAKKPERIIFLTPFIERWTHLKPSPDRGDVFNITDVKTKLDANLLREIQKMEAFLEKHSARQECAYCKNTMTMVSDESFYPKTELKNDTPIFVEFSGSVAPTRIDNTEFFQQCYECISCGWWSMNIYHKSYQYTTGTERGGRRYGWHLDHYGLEEDVDIKILVFGMIKEFDVSSSEVSLSELRRWLTRHPDHIAHTDPFHFERLMADCFKSQSTYSDVIKVGGRKDRGIDIILIDQSQEKTLVQVKRRRHTGS